MLKKKLLNQANINKLFLDVNLNKYIINKYNVLFDFKILVQKINKFINANNENNIFINLVF